MAALISNDAKSSLSLSNSSVLVFVSAYVVVIPYQKAATLSLSELFLDGIVNAIGIVMPNFLGQAKFYEVSMGEGGNVIIGYVLDGAFDEGRAMLECFHALFVKSEVVLQGIANMRFGWRGGDKSIPSCTLQQQQC